MFVRNTGQFHPRVAYVALVPDTLLDQYQGCGEVAVVVDAQGDPLAIDYDTERHIDVQPGQYLIHAMASCHELVVDAGTSDAAVLTALLAEGGKNDEHHD